VGLWSGLYPNSFWRLLMIRLNEECQGSRLSRFSSCSSRAKGPPIEGLEKIVKRSQKAKRGSTAFLGLFSLPNYLALLTTE